MLIMQLDHEALGTTLHYAQILGLENRNKEEIFSLVVEILVLLGKISHTLRK